VYFNKGGHPHISKQMFTCKDDKHTLCTCNGMPMPLCEKKAVFDPNKCFLE
jgi:hypothetical protein